MFHWNICCQNTKKNPLKNSPSPQPPLQHYTIVIDKSISAVPRHGDSFYTGNQIEYSRILYKSSTYPFLFSPFLPI